MGLLPVATAFNAEKRIVQVAEAALLLGYERDQRLIGARKLLAVGHRAGPVIVAPSTSTATTKVSLILDDPARTPSILLTI